MTHDQGALKPDYPWSKIGWISFAVIMVVSSLLGFVVLSRYQLNGEPLDIWAAICRGLGITSDSRPGASQQPALRIPTNVAWTTATLDRVRSGDVERGANVALNCVACHGSATANPGGLVPTLDGMDAASIFKQLSDYRSGKRLWGVMSAIAKASAIEDFADVAAYFSTRTGLLHANLPERVPQGGRAFRQSDPAARLAFAGDPQRGIAPCSACHGPGGFRLGAPPLTGQYAAYIERQLASFAQGIRHNDIYEQMRAIARQLTQDEMKALADFYGSQGQEVRTAKN
jgi:cytochrome c553